MDRKALLILGMHRAGTSALARVCSLRGAALPAQVLPPNAGNETGYWEPRGVVELNDRILDYFDLAWDDPFVAARLPATIPEFFHAEAREVIAREYGDAPLLVLKDPRCTLLQAFWIEALRASGIRACPVVMMRPGTEVVASLMRRDHTSPTGAALLYVAYGLEAAAAAGHGASFVTYDQLLANWRGCTDRIAAEQDFAWGDTTASEVGDYLRPPAREARQFALPSPLPAWMDTVWRWCDAAAAGQPAPLETLAGLRDEVLRLAPLLQPLLQDRVRRQRETEALQQAALTERDTALQVYRDTDARLQDVQDDYAALQAAGAALQAERDDVLDLYQRTDAQLRQTQDDYARRDEDYLAARNALAAAHREGEELRRELAVILGSRSWKLTAPLRALMRLLRGDRGGDPRPRAPGTSFDAAAAGTTSIDGVLARPHAGLRRFLVPEFGETAAADAVLRIDRYRLPIPGQEARSAASAECDEAQGLAWAQAIAQQAARRGDGDADVPDVSIVVPVYNQLPFTLACIDALLAHESRYRFEILVGDDASTDATAAVLAQPIPGVRHVRHENNLGFVRNCNETARHARGRYVLFLNNDTQVLPRWLDELIDLLEADPRIGLAGSKLVYPDGRLQECGAIVWRDGSAWNYGRLADPRRPEFCYVRDADYISGASIALRRGLWEELGGFDELFVPAYAEDADLAFRVRDRGLRTVVQPLSQLLHFEGISSGTDLGSGAKAYQVENLRKLHARWGHVLQGHRDNADQPELEKERAITRRALFVDHCTPDPKEDAGSVVACEVMRGFVDNGYKVTFVPEDNFAHVGAATRALQRQGIEAIYHPAYPRMSAFLAARNDPFDVIFLHRFGVGAAHMDALRRKYPRARIIFLNADMHHVREMRQAELSGDAAAMAGARRTRDQELRVISRADVALVHSDYEQALLQRELPDARVVLFPLIHDPATHVPALASRSGVCFVGGFRHPPNADGVRWFVDAVWPLVLQVVPDARLNIVGSHMPAEIAALGERQGVRAVGFVDDLDAFLGRCRITVAPLRYGAGAKGKVAASLAQGVPAVCTSIAAEGMQLDPGVNVLTADRAEEFAAHVVTLLTDDARWQRLSEAGLAYAHATTSRACAGARMRSILGVEAGAGQPASVNT